MGQRSNANGNAARRGAQTAGNDLPAGRAMPAVSDAVVRTVAYVDVFDYPLTAQEVHRYLIGVAAAPAHVGQALDHEVRASRLVERAGFFTLPGRESIVDVRRQRQQFARRLWPDAIRYGRLTAALPFVRMVAVTGSLAVDNAEPQADIDYLIVTEPGRLWLCRALTIFVVRLAAQSGVHLCPNYFLSQNALVFTERNLYTAHELVQMVPVSGVETYERLRRLNDWTSRFLPNAARAPRQPAYEHLIPVPAKPQQLARRLAESALRTPLGGWLERWEMERKIAKFGNGSGPQQVEAAFCPDWCKGHFDGHGHRIMQAYEERISHIEG